MISAFVNLATCDGATGNVTIDGNLTVIGVQSPKNTKKE